MSFRLRGRVAAVCGRRIRLRIPAAIVGDSALVGGEGPHVLGAIERVERDGATLSALGDATGIACGDFATIERPVPRALLGLAALGRTVDARGRAGDGGPPVDGLPLRASSASIERVAVSEPLWTGIRAIDGLLSIGRGARLGIYGAPGAGKSTLLSLIAKFVGADAVVVALVGERHREATEWRAHVDARTSLVVATCDRPPDERVAAAKLALAQARSLCERGLDVVVLLDS
ncbi:MAG: ATP-binding cassette domain-containing protein, partial [Candidatus Eremiobacteraeota bacterium]|nr:ATP-binding cassette domain-containing protein [Candidatus Eremiobacteraeota bacterium]